MLNLNYARAAVAAHAQHPITEARITALLSPYNNTATIANVTQVTLVQTAAKFKDVLIQKVTRGSVLLFANALNYAECIKRSCKKLGEEGCDIEKFEVSESSFTHDPACYSLVRNKNNPTQAYLYMHFNKGAESVYFHKGALLSLEAVASFCTPSVAAKLLNPEQETYNVKNDITHTIMVRTVKLQNIVRLAALKQVLV